MGTYIGSALEGFHPWESKICFGSSFLGFLGFKQYFLYKYEEVDREIAKYDKVDMEWAQSYAVDISNSTTAKDA